MKNVINSYFKSSVSLWIKLDYFEKCEFTGSCIQKYSKNQWVQVDVKINMEHMRDILCQMTPGPMLE
jgi:hypothetical protein